MPDAQWTDMGSVEELKKKPLQEVSFGKTTIALTYKEGSFAAISGSVIMSVVRWGKARSTATMWSVPGTTGSFITGQDKVNRGTNKIRFRPMRPKCRAAGSISICRPHTAEEAVAQDPSARTPGGRQAGPIRVVGISTTAMTMEHPRYSTSDAMLDVALSHARSALKLETQCIKLRELNFRSCEGFYSKSAQACTWPCSITQMDPADQLDRVYEAIVHWADVILISTPIRWGNASSLYFKMVERMNCIQNQETIANKHLLKNKVAAFIIMGGQDNVQGVAGQLMTFFAEVGCQFPQFPFIAHSRGWSAEDMERNVKEVQNSQELRKGAQELVVRAADLAKLMIGGQLPEHPLARGGRKAHQLDSEPTR